MYTEYRGARSENRREVEGLTIKVTSTPCSRAPRCSAHERLSRNQRPHFHLHSLFTKRTLSSTTIDHPYLKANPTSVQLSFSSSFSILLPTALQFNLLLVLSLKRFVADVHVSGHRTVACWEACVYSCLVYIHSQGRLQPHPSLRHPPLITKTTYH